MTRQANGKPPLGRRAAPPRRRSKAAPLPAGVVPNHAHGQNFLRDPVILAREIDYAGVAAGAVVLEIGPGIGSLTEQLLARDAVVHALEIDRQFAPLLGDLQARYAQLRLHWGDATVLDWPADVTHVVANLPYKVSLPLIFRMIERPLRCAVVIIQQRLARRLAARPGAAGYSRISVTAQRLASFRLLETVPARAFTPPPEVDSAMLRIRPTRPRFHLDDPDGFRNLLDGVFLRREAPLEAALGALDPAAAVGMEALDAAARRARVADTPPETFGRLAAALHRAGVAIAPIPEAVKRKAQKLSRG